MSDDNLWNEYELYFYSEFINSETFPIEKKMVLKYSMGYYFINKDFTIYQEKELPYNEITQTDYDRNFGTFIWILYNLPINKVIDFLVFHFDKYPNNKSKFLNFIYYELEGSILRRGTEVLPPPQQKVIAMEWCLNKLNMLRGIDNKPKSKKEFVHPERIEKLKSLSIQNFDLKKLIKLLEELNDNFSLGNYLSVAMLGRAIIDHIPPLFGFSTFNEVANNIGNTSFKKNMGYLNISMRSISDNYLHMTIRKKENLPNENQVDFSRELDFLLSEIIRIVN